MAFPWTYHKPVRLTLVRSSVSRVITLRHVANLLTSDELDKLTRSVLAKLRPLSSVQRETVIRQILEVDDWRRRHHRRGFTPPTTFAAAIRPRRGDVTELRRHFPEDYSIAELHAILDARACEWRLVLITWFYQRRRDLRGDV